MFAGVQIFGRLFYRKILRIIKAPHSWYGFFLLVDPDTRISFYPFTYSETCRMATYIVWEGASRIDGAPVVCIVSGVGAGKRSKNEKTGEMAQVWYLLADVSPWSAANSGADISICGSCAHRGYIDEGGTNRDRSCYVELLNAPRAIWEAYQKGSYDYLPPEFRWQNQSTRLGAYGDPVVVPSRINRNLIRRGNGNTGYTHQWRLRKFQSSRRLLMASCETIQDVAQAQALGWRTFRTMSPDSADLTGSEISCPASVEAGNIRTCETCLACDGSRSQPREIPLQRSIAIVVHGPKSKTSSYRRHIGGGR